MLHPLLYIPGMSRTPANAIDLSWSFLRILPTCTISTRWTWLFRGDFPTFPSNPCMAVSCPPVLQRLELGAEAYVETPHRMNICYTYHYQLLYNKYISIYYNITILHVITISDHIAYVDACLAFICVCTCIHVFTCFYCKLFDEQPWYRVLGFLVVGVVQTDAQIGNSVLVPSSSSSGILGLLPSTSPYDIIDDGPTWVNFKGMKTPQVSLMDCPDSWWWGFHVWQCLYLVPSADLSRLQIGDVWWKHVRCNNLSFDLVHCGGIVFFPSPSLLRQLPENYSAFPDISGRLFLKIHSDGFAAPLQLVFLPFLTKFLMKGLVRWVLPVCYCMEYCPLEIT